MADTGSAQGSHGVAVMGWDGGGARNILFLHNKWPTRGSATTSAFSVWVVGWDGGGARNTLFLRNK
jgi:hypothetical protein